MLDMDWLNNDLENLTTSFNSTGNETIDGRTMFYFPGMTHNVRENTGLIASETHF